jgi:hypothetical protein
MTDEDRQAERLRERLDHELITVRATAEACERLDSRISPSPGSPPMRWNLRRLPAVLALPVAVAAVAAAAVAVPALLRSDTASMVPGARVTRSAPVPAPAPTSTAAPSVVPSVGPSPAAAAPVPTPSTLKLRVNPKTGETGRRVVLTVTGAPRRSGDLTVIWADRSKNTVVPGSCSVRPVTAPSPLGHTYTRAGRYKIQVLIDGCDSEQATPASVSVDVTVVLPVARAR